MRSTGISVSGSQPGLCSGECKKSATLDAELWPGMAVQALQGAEETVSAISDR